MGDRAGNSGQSAAVVEAHPAEVALRQPGSPEAVDRVALLLALVLALLICAWTSSILLWRPVPFAILAPQAAVGVEAASALARLFGALVLSLFPMHGIGQRLRWVATGFGVLGFGGLIFGFLQPLLFGSLDLNTTIYATLLVRTLAGALFVIGLIPRRPPRFTRRALLSSAAGFGLLSLLVVNAQGLLPVLATSTDIGAALAAGDAPLRGLTAWHWLLSFIPLGLALAAVWGAARHSRPGLLGRWLLVAMVLLAGSQLHAMFWPSIYSPVLTTADLLRLLFAATVTVGGILELRRIAAEYAELLALAREHSQRLNELARLKADFTAMVAHELSSPIAAIRGWSDVLAMGGLDASTRAQALTAIRAETDMLNTLVADVHAAAQVERADFALQRRPVLLDDLLVEAGVYAQTLSGEHPISVVAPAPLRVLADPDRISQVLRNLLSNAAKYSAPGTPIEIRAMAHDNRARVEVVDHGSGIAVGDLERIFEKFSRGRDQTGQLVPGLGLGLYLSRRIVRAHGSELRVASQPGQGATFAFELEVVQ